MAARIGRISWKYTLKCSSRHSCESKLKTGVACIHSSSIRSFFLRDDYYKRRFAKTVWPITWLSNSCSIGIGSLTLSFSSLILGSYRTSRQSLAENIKGSVPFIFTKRRYSCSAHDSITEYKNVLKHGDFIFYEKTNKNRTVDFEKFKSSFLEDFLFKEDFISPEEESLLLHDVEKALKRLKYEYDHWDGVIYGYREIEKSRWTPENQKIIQRIKDEAFDNETTMLPGVHVLDLFKDGYIKPHVDSKFCGRRIAGVSLLSTAVMRLKPKNCESYSLFVDVLLKPRSLYIMRNYARYELTHEVLPDEVSYFGDTKITRDRRIAVVMREEPTT